VRGCGVDVDVDVSYVDVLGVERRDRVDRLAAVSFESAAPYRSFPSFKGQRNYPGFPGGRWGCCGLWL
jgi:hypothetical protein